MQPTRTVALALAAALALSACAHPGQSTYTGQEVGRATVVTFGKVLAVREVDIVGDAGGTGTTLGAVGGGLTGAAFGRDGGKAAAIGAGVLAGALVGAMVEQESARRKGLEYTVSLDTGITMTIVQEMPKEGERTFQPGDPVMVQNRVGYQRVLPADGIQVPPAKAAPSGVSDSGKTPGATAHGTGRVDGI